MGGQVTDGVADQQGELGRLLEPTSLPPHVPGTVEWSPESGVGTFLNSIRVDQPRRIHVHQH